MSTTSSCTKWQHKKRNIFYRSEREKKILDTFLLIRRLFKYPTIISFYGQSNHKNFIYLFISLFGLHKTEGEEEKQVTSTTKRGSKPSTISQCKILQVFPLLMSIKLKFYSHPLTQYNTFQFWIEKWKLKIKSIKATNFSIKNLSKFSVQWSSNLVVSTEQECWRRPHRYQQTWGTVTPSTKYTKIRSCKFLSSIILRVLHNLNRQNIR